MRVWMADMYEGEGLINFQALADAGCAGVVLKSSMGGGMANLNWLSQAVNGVRQAGLRLGFYHWVDPTQSATRQAGYLRQAVERFGPDFLALDNEQWWASWDKYHRYLRKEIPGSEVPRLRGDVIIQSFLDTMAAVAGLRPLMMQYSARWFQQGYCPQMSDHNPRWGGWVASYDVGTRVRQFPTVESFETALDELNAPRYVPNNMDVWMWQFTDRWGVPGVAPMDLSVWMGDEASLDEAIGAGASDPFFPPYEPTEQRRSFAIPWLNVRSGPSTVYAVTRRIYPGGTFYVFEKRQGNGYEWGRISDSEWVALRWSVIV